MTYLHDLLAAFADCNLHFCLYGAFGATFLTRAVLCRPEHHPGDTREDFLHGIVYLLLGLLK